MATLADCVAEAVDRTRELLAAVGLSTAEDATNDSAVRSIGWAYAALGLSPSSGVTPGDADLAEIAPARYYDLADLAEYRLLCTCRNRWTKTRVQVGANSLYLSDLRDSLDRRLAGLESSLRSRFGLGLSPLVGGRIKLGPASDCDDDEFAARRRCP
jgi:hypothetical protein